MWLVPCCERTAPPVYEDSELSRVHVFAITLNKANGARLGLEFDFVKGREVLPVRAVNGHLAEEWNRGHPESKVRPGDRVVEVNGARGRSDLLMRALMGNDDRLHITLVRAEGARNPTSSKCVQPPAKPRHVYQEEVCEMKYTDDQISWNSNAGTPHHASKDHTSASSFGRPATEQLLFALHDVTAYQTMEEGDQIFTSLSSTFSVLETRPHQHHTK